MLHEFAFEPEALATWEEFQRLMGQVGIGYGRVAVEYPAEWRRLVLAAGRWQPIERQRVVERLARGSIAGLDRMDPSFDRSDWLLSAERHHASRSFYKIVARENPRNSPCVIRSSEAYDDNPKWKVPREVITDQTPEKLVGFLAPLIRLSREIRLVDRFFNPNKGAYVRMLEQIVDVALRGGRMVRCFEIHVEDRLAKDYFEDGWRKHVASRVPSRLEVEVFFWAEARGQLHPRYLLTEHGGIRVDGGFDDKGREMDTDVMLMEDETWKQRLVDYSRKSWRFQLVDSVCLRGAGV